MLSLSDSIVPESASSFSYSLFKIPLNLLQQYGPCLICAGRSAVALIEH